MKSPLSKQRFPHYIRSEYRINTREELENLAATAVNFGWKKSFKSPEDYAAAVRFLSRVLLDKYKHC